MDENDLLSISEAADLLGVASSALRYYERKGLVKPQRSKWSNYRGYGYLELLELTDIIHFRNAGLAVGDLPELFRSPIENTIVELDKEIDRTLDELEELRLKLSAATHLSHKIRRRLSLAAMDWRLGTKPSFLRLAPFNTLDREQLSEYLRQRDELRYAAFFASAEEPQAFVDCAVSDDGLGRGVWHAGKDTRYVEFLLTTSYGETDKNDLATWRDRLAAEGIRIGAVVAEYLTYDVDPATGRRIDCYDAWAEIL